MDVTTGTVTVAFTDLVDSSGIEARRGPQAADELRRSLHAAVVESVDQAAGRVVKNLGDGVMAVFPSASSAVDASVAMQKGVHRAASQFDHDPLCMRVGVSVDDATEEEGDWFGQPVVEAARLCAEADGGEILVSDAIRLLSGLRSGAPFEALGARSLKGLPEPLIVHRVMWDPPDAVPAELPPRLRAAAASTLVGRRAELQVLADVLDSAAEGRGQVVLIGGEPGVGKSSLLGTVAADASERASSPSPAAATRLSAWPTNPSSKR